MERPVEKLCENLDDFKHHEKDILKEFNYLFDIGHADALERIKIDEDKVFLQREPGHHSYLVDVDKRLSEKEEGQGKKKIRRKEQKKKNQANFIKEHTNIFNLA